MKLSDYQARALETALPTALTPDYLVPMIVGEVGELFGALAKSVRDEWDEERTCKTLTKEYGDVAWGVALLAKHYGFARLDRWVTEYDLPTRKDFLYFLLRDAESLVHISQDENAIPEMQIKHLWWNLEDNCKMVTGSSFDEVLEANLAKLADRKDRGVISGSGDER